MMKKQKTIKIDPRIFISGPYIKCPKCNKNSFGVLMMTNGNGFTRRCKKCWYSKNFSLPLLNKRIIYLDQFAISQMMKAVNRKLGKVKTVDKFWFSVFEKLEKLNKLQLIVCPRSTFHREESIFFEPKAMKRMCEHFSNGVSFYDPATIRRFQLDNFFRKKNKIKNRNIKREDIMQGQINEWIGKLQISFDFFKIDEKEMDDLLKSRESIFKGIAEVFERWKKEKDKKFEDWFSEEALAWGKAMSERYVRQITELAMLQTTDKNNSAERYIASCLSEESILIHNLNLFSSGDHLKKIRNSIAFLQSKDLIKVPFNEIASLIWASIAHQAAHGGRKKPPNKGTANDIDMISTLLPYCDAMFVDNEMFEILNHGTVKKKITKYKTNLFSLSRKIEFMKYLDDIENKAPASHKELVNKVYGENWLTPFWSMYEKD